MKQQIVISIFLVLVAPIAWSAAQMAPTGENIPADLSGEIKSRGILGYDDRKSSLQLPTYLEKYRRRVGQLITFLPAEKGKISRSTCTGSLIQKNYIITAAHCALDANGQLLDNQFFYPDIQEGRVSYNKYRVVRVFFPSDYSHNANADTGRDIAIMELDRSDEGKHAGEVAGWFGFWGKNEFPSGKVTTIGYPGDKEHGHQYFQENCNAVNSNPYDPDDLRIDCDVFRGQSGSAVLVYSPDYDAYHVHGVIQSESRVMNFGSRVSPERQNIFNYIVKGEFGSSAYQAENFSESWRSLAYAKPDKVHVYARNECGNDDLYIAYNYKSDSGEWVTEGFNKLEPKHEMEIFNTGNGVYYLSARNPSGKIFTRSDMKKYMPYYDTSIGLQKYNVKEFGTFTYSFGCD
ncbi:serine protease [Alcanivorax sp. DP30]|uniref:trypsin-like serine peptidase n=1 Tax=Alcanivorax sp. DP30 TaxID=2606217 RepID=UPI001369A18F|nr:trypsin-like serine protease [Alcanivorax sp. DP30]MZR64436.1 trypsin-like serine protease [Alcanivorax sp. DP30]